VVGEVHDGLALVLAAEQLSPDVIVSDVSMPGLEGIAAATQILQRSPPHGSCS
jgi:CheY-like chemotaxis protein